MNDELDVLRKEDPEGKQIVKLDSADEYTGVLTKDGSLLVWGKNDRGQMGVGSGIGIDMVESENIPVQINVGETPRRIKDFHTGMNTMLIQDEEDKVYKTGLKLDYTPKEVYLPEEFQGADTIQGMTCGRRHYVMWNKNN